MDWATLWSAGNSLVVIATAIGAAKVAYTNNKRSKKLEREGTVTTELQSVTVVTDAPDALPTPDSNLSYTKGRVTRVERKGKQTIDLSVSATTMSEAVAAAAFVVQKNEGGDNKAGKSSFRAVVNDSAIGASTLNALGVGGPASSQQIGWNKEMLCPSVNPTTQAVALFVNGVTNIPGGSKNVMQMHHNGRSVQHAAWYRPDHHDVAAGMPCHETEVRIHGLYSELQRLKHRIAMLEHALGRSTMNHHAGGGGYDKPPQPPSASDQDAAWMEGGIGGMLHAAAAIPELESGSDSDADGSEDVVGGTRTVESPASRPEIAARDSGGEVDTAPGAVVVSVAHPDPVTADSAAGAFDCVVLSGQTAHITGPDYV